MVAWMMVAAFLSPNYSVDGPTERAATLLPRLAEKVGERWRIAPEFENAALRIRLTEPDGERLRRGIAEAVQGRWLYDAGVYRLVPDEAARDAAQARWAAVMERRWSEKQVRLAGGFILPDGNGGNLVETLLGKAVDAVPLARIKNLAPGEFLVYSSSPKPGQQRLAGSWSGPLRGMRGTLESLRRVAPFAEGDLRITVSVWRHGARLDYRGYLIGSDGMSLSAVTGGFGLGATPLGPEWKGDPNKMSARWKLLGARGPFDSLAKYWEDPETHEPLGLVADDWVETIEGEIIACWPSENTLLWRVPRSPDQAPIDLQQFAGAEFVTADGLKIVRPHDFRSQHETFTPRAPFAALVKNATVDRSPTLDEFAAFGRFVPRNGVETCLATLYRMKRNHVYDQNDNGWETMALLAAANLGERSPEGEVSAAMHDLPMSFRERVARRARMGAWSMGGEEGGRRPNEPTEWPAGMTVRIVWRQQLLFEYETVEGMRSKTPYLPGESLLHARVDEATTLFFSIPEAGLRTMPLWQYAFEADSLWLNPETVYERYGRGDSAMDPPR